MSRSTIIDQEKHRQTEDDSRTKTKRKRKSSSKDQDDNENKETGDRDESIDAADHSSVSATQINDEPPKKEKKKKKKKATEIIAREEATEECASTTISKKSTCDDDDDDSDQEDGQEDLKLETETISHKERRKRRKLEKKKSAQKDDDEDGETKTSEAVTSSRKVESIFTTATRSKHGVWVGNLLFTTTAQELARFFEPAGKVTRLNMPAGKRAHEANTGFAYVDFDSAEAVDAALEKSECLLGGRKLLIKRSSDYSGRPSAIPASITPSSSTTPSASIPPPTVSKSVRKILDRQKQPPAPCIYFGNLGFETTSEGIVSMLHAHHQAQQVWKPKKKTNKMNGRDQEEEEEDDDDEEEEEEQEEGRGRAKPDTRSAQVGIRKVRMGTFEDTGKCKGFAFVDFETIDQATNVLVNPKNHRLDGRTLTVEYASVEAVKRGGGSVRSMQQQKRGYPGSAGSTGPGRPDRVQRDGAQQQPRRPPSAEARPRTHPNPSSTLSHQSTASFAQPVHSPPPAPDEPVRKVKKEFKGRQKPGAALANAQRAPTGIVKNPETVGKKIVFSSFPRRLSI